MVSSTGWQEATGGFTVSETQVGKLGVLRSLWPSSSESESENKFLQVEYLRKRKEKVILSYLSFCFRGTYFDVVIDAVHMLTGKGDDIKTPSHALKMEKTPQRANLHLYFSSGRQSSFPRSQ